LFTAIIAGFLISALGGSRVQIGGPAGAFIVIVYGILERYGVAKEEAEKQLSAWERKASDSWFSKPKA
jgi:MFS superfamily sulfate permease-like transporter